MKKTILTFVILFFANSLFAQNSKSLGYSSGNNPHDSLLFDGAYENHTDKQEDKKNCWKVKHVWGRVTGTRDTIIHVPVTCGWRKNEGVESYVKQIRSQMKDGDEIYDDDTFEMDEGSFIQIEVTTTSRFGQLAVIGGNPPPTFILTAMCKKFTIPSCKDDVHWKFEKGKYFWETDNWPLQYVGTSSCVIKNNGTKYSLDVNDDDDNIKVYEGSVTVWPQHVKASSSDEMQKLAEDYKNGKISLDEYMSKSKVLSEQVLSDANKVTNGVTVEAGNQVTMGDKIGDVIPIGTDDIKWWDNVNHNK
jgi:hypothetical protein